MVDLIPENVDGVVVLNALSKCPPNCTHCCDITVGIHNWLMANNLKYLVVDLQDEKVVCTTFLEELLQLRKRLRIPFAFVGAMEKPMQVIHSYDLANQFPLFNSPEEAARVFKEKYASLMAVTLENITFGQPLAVPRPGTKFSAEDEDSEEASDGDQDNDQDEPVEEVDDGPLDDDESDDD